MLKDERLAQGYFPVGRHLVGIRKGRLHRPHIKRNPQYLHMLALHEPCTGLPTWELCTWNAPRPLRITAGIIVQHLRATRMFREEPQNILKVLCAALYGSFHKWRDPNIDPKLLPQKGTPNFGKPPYAVF